MEATELAFNTNVFGPQRMLRAVLPAMREAKSGLIFNISSQLGRLVIPASGHYSSTKFALEALSEAMAYELVTHGVDVCIIQPGGYPTNMWKNRNGYTLALRDRLEPSRREGYPQLTASMGAENGSGRTTDPMDVPNAIAQIISMPSGTRPLRKAVHPTRRPHEAVNEVCAQVQVAWLGQSGYGPRIKAVHNV